MSETVQMTAEQFREVVFETAGPILDGEKTPEEVMIKLGLPVDEVGHFYTVLVKQLEKGFRTLIEEQVSGNLIQSLKEGKAPDMRELVDKLNPREFYVFYSMMAGLLVGERIGAWRERACSSA